MTLPGFMPCETCGGEGIDRPEGCICIRFTDTDFRIADLTCQVHGANGYTAQPDDDWKPCPDCNGAGQVPDPETVETVARVLIDGDEFTPPWDEALDPLKAWYRAQARAALLAYARYVKENA